MLQKPSTEKVNQQKQNSLQVSSRKYIITHLRGDTNDMKTEKIVNGSLLGYHAYKKTSRNQTINIIT